MRHICREFLSNRRKRVIVDAAANERNPIVSGIPQGSVLGLLLFILYTCKMFELVDKRLYAYADDSSLIAVPSKQRTHGPKPKEYRFLNVVMTYGLIKPVGYCSNQFYQTYASLT